MPVQDGLVWLHGRATFPSVMDYLAHGGVIDLPACLARPKAEIGVLLEGKISLVQVANLIHDSAPDEHARSGDRLHRGDFIVRKVGHQVAPEEAAAGKKPGKAAEIGDDVPGA